MSGPGPPGLRAAGFDRAAGVLVGLATGDALGAGYEFATPPQGDAAMIGGGLGPWAPGEWTDDTQQAVCVVESAAGGSLMRTASVALAHLGDDDAIVAAAIAVSELTHADPLAGEACAIWCIAIDRAVRERRLDGIWDGVDLLPGDAPTRWSGWLLAAETEPAAAFRPNGSVVRALQAAWAAVHQTPVPRDQPCRHLQHALHAAIRIGDDTDTDTVAAIAGALLGARWGSSAVPLRWRAMLHGWPDLRARDLVRLAVLAARGGTDDDIGWPSASDVTGAYRTRYGDAPFTVALPDDPGVVLGNAPAATKVECDVMVSLCRMGTARPPGVGARHEIVLVDSPHPADNPNLDFVLRDTADAITTWRDEGKAVFVHCVAGVSRTPTVAAAYVATRLGISGTDALRRVVEAHPRADPNPGFVAALARFA